MDGLEQLTIFENPVNITSGTEELVSIVFKEEKINAENEEQEIISIEETPYIELELVPYEIGDSVRVDPDSLNENDVLNYNYLLDYLKKKGIVKKVIYKPTLQYEVAYGDAIACMYHNDLTI